MCELVVVFDKLKGFAEEGVLTSDRVKNIIEPIRIYLEHHPGDTVFVSEAHEEDSSEFHDFPVHCIRETKEAEVVERLRAFAHTCFEKNSVNAFHAESFRKYLIEKLTGIAPESPYRACLASAVG